MKHLTSPQISFDRLRFIKEQQFDITLPTTAVGSMKVMKFVVLKWLSLFASVLMLDEVW